MLVTFKQQVRVKMQPNGVGRKPVFGSAFALVACLLLAACASGSEPGIVYTKGGLGCVDDSAECIRQRKATLDGMMADPSRKWVREPASAHAYASGVRLFAYKNKKKELTCEELTLARREADQAPAALRASGTGLTPAQVSRGVMLAHEVGRELGNEYNRRCRKG